MVEPVEQRQHGASEYKLIHTHIHLKIQHECMIYSDTHILLFNFVLTPINHSKPISCKPTYLSGGDGSHCISTSGYMTSITLSLQGAGIACDLLDHFQLHVYCHYSSENYHRNSPKKKCGWETHFVAPTGSPWGIWIPLAPNRSRQTTGQLRYLFPVTIGTAFHVPFLAFMVP